VRFEHVDFSYDGVRSILKDVSFDIPAGRKVAVVGPSGSGKSTLARLLFRFYDVNRGRITVDGQDIRDVQQASVRAALGVVPQDTVLFNDTIVCNISPAGPHARRVENGAGGACGVQELLPAAETSVRARSQTPGGEGACRSRRTVLKNPPILIFDEAPGARFARECIRRARPGVATATLACTPPFDNRRRRRDPRALSHGSIVGAAPSATQIAAGTASPRCSGSSKGTDVVRPRSGARSPESERLVRGAVSGPV
jgi:ABC-type ATPase involved in cell division